MPQRKINNGRILILEEQKEFRLCFRLPIRYGIPRCIQYRKFIPGDNDKRPGEPLALIKNGSLTSALNCLLWELEFGLVDYYVDDRVDCFGQEYLLFSFIFRPTIDRAMGSEVYAIFSMFLGYVWRRIQPWDNPDGTVCIVASDRVRRRFPEEYLVVCREGDLGKIANITIPESARIEPPQPTKMI